MFGTNCFPILYPPPPPPIIINQSLIQNISLTVRYIELSLPVLLVFPHPVAYTLLCSAMGAVGSETGRAVRPTVTGEESFSRAMSF